jgi:hypothetical protein
MFPGPTGHSSCGSPAVKHQQALTRDFASLPHGRFALIEKEVFPRQ